MNYFQQFLESSTIHGLVYISTESKIARLFWILVVAIGFTIASLLIQQSFDNWSESPIKTTIENKPISEITFPKVTVCPPRNTFTDLNYDFMMLDNMTMPNETRDWLFDAAYRELFDSYADAVFANLSKLEEENRFYNWYHGFTQIDLPSWNERNGQSLMHSIYTSATSGSVTTQFFGQKYDPQKVETQFDYKVWIFVPPEAVKNPNYTLTLEIQKISMRVSGDSLDKIFIYGGIGDLDPEENFIVLNFTAPSKTIAVNIERNIKKKDTENNIDLQKMPGFLIKWRYNKKPEDYAYESFSWGQDMGTKEFRNFMRLFSKSKNFAAIAQKIKGSQEMLKRYCSKNDFEGYVDELLTAIENHPELETNNETSLDTSIESLEIGGKVFSNLATCTTISSGIKEFLHFFRDILMVSSPKLVLQSLNNIAQRGWNTEKLQNIMRKMTENMNLNVANIKRIFGNKDSCRKDRPDLTPEQLATMTSDFQQKVTNHPPHIVEEDSTISPSALIPFCWFGNEADVGVKVDQFKFPVCNSFKPIMRKDQLCYEFDPAPYIKNKSGRMEKNGLNLIINENRDRHLDLMKKFESIPELNFYDIKKNEKEQEGTKIYLDAIGKYYLLYRHVDFICSR